MSWQKLLDNIDEMSNDELRYEMKTFKEWNIELKAEQARVNLMKRIEEEDFMFLGQEQYREDYIDEGIAGNLATGMLALKINAFSNQISNEHNTQKQLALLGQQNKYLSWLAVALQKLK